MPPTTSKASDSSEGLTVAHAVPSTSKAARPLPEPRRAEVLDPEEAAMQAQLKAKYLRAAGRPALRHQVRRGACGTSVSKRLACE